MNVLSLVTVDHASAQANERPTGISGMERGALVYHHCHIVDLLLERTKLSL
jgi:hypothetical protein